MTWYRRTDVLLLAVVLLVALCAWLLGVSHSPPAAAAPTSPSATTTSDDGGREGIHVSAVGKVTGRPDVLRIDLGVDIRRASVDSALSQANSTMAKLRTALIRNGVATQDLQTNDVSISPEYDDKGRAITAYVVHQGLTVKIRNLERAGRTIDAAARAVGDAARINGVSFAIEDNEALLAQARKNAFASAKAKAELYAAEAGRSLGAVQNVTESVDAPGPYYYNNMAAPMAARAVADMAVDPGQQQLTVTVNVDWRFG
jgi:uncharacterized protein YggE